MVVLRRLKGVRLVFTRAIHAMRECAEVGDAQCE